MIYRDNFKQFVQSLPDKYKQQVIEDDDHEYVFIRFESYGSIMEFTLTNDDCGEYHDIINSDDWTGMEYLLSTRELQDILNEGDKS